MATPWRVPVYSVEAAQELLPHVRLLVRGAGERLLRLRMGWSQDPALYRAVEANAYIPQPPGGTAVALADVPRSLTPLVQLHDELDRLGVTLRDPIRGLLDFYHEREGRLVYLCYRLDEERLAYWHELDAGFAGRQPL